MLCGARPGGTVASLHIFRRNALNGRGGAGRGGGERGEGKGGGNLISEVKEFSKLPIAPRPLCY